MTRCAMRAPNKSLPAGLPVETARIHPSYKHLLEPGGQCEDAAGHEGPHRVGCLVWHDPPLVWHDPPLLMVGGVPFTAPAEPAPPPI